MTVKTPATPASKMDRTPVSTPAGPRGVREEKIFVTIWVRPLSEREHQHKDQVAWARTDDHTIVFKNSSQQLYLHMGRRILERHTMRGITKNVVNDIYKHTIITPERDFVIKISALKIYNEMVRDLLDPKSGPLWLLDDPEKGIVVEKLVEETTNDSQHLRQLIDKCEGSNEQSARGQILFGGGYPVAYLHGIIF